MEMPEMRTSCCTRTPAGRRRGFTIIELLAVVVIIAALATIAIAKFGDSKRRAYIAAMKSDLHNLGMTAESKFAADNSYAAVEVPRGSAGVTLTFSGDATKWAASATHEALPGFECTIRSGGGIDAEPICR
jgi:prepilin-type N-terminal cleavage/methylation domain-containing protein